MDRIQIVKKALIDKQGVFCSAYVYSGGDVIKVLVEDAL